MNIEMIDDDEERFETSCTLTEIFQPLVPAISFVLGMCIGGALVLLYLSTRI